MSTLTASVLAAVRGRKKASRLEDDRELPEDMEDEEKKDAEGEEDETEAEEEDRDPAAEGEEDDTAAEGEEKDPDAEDEEDPKQARTSKVRRAEQGRIRSILTHPKADANPGLAAELAFGSRFYSAKEASALLDHSGAAGSRLAGRMNGRSPKIGSGASATPPSERKTLVANVKQTIAAMHGRKPASE